MATHREFGGKQYRCDLKYNEKTTANKVAKSHRNGGYNARVVKEEDRYAVYLRKRKV